MAKNKQNTLLALGLGMMTTLTSHHALAKDALAVTVAPSDAYVFEENGNPLSVGTYAVGTLKVHMVVVGTEWPESFGPIQLDLAVREKTAKPQTRYSVPIGLRQVGGDLTLTPQPATFDVTDSLWQDYSTVSITVPDDIRNDPELNADGTVLVGNLQMDTTARRSFFDTVTTLRIFATLVHPDEVACLKHATFVTDNSLGRNLSDPSDGLEFSYYYGNSGFKWSMSPNNSQLSDNILIVNTCPEAQDYDVAIGLPTGFQKKAPGNVVKSYVSQVANAGSLMPWSTPTDPYTSLLNAQAQYPTSTAEGTSLCVVTNHLEGLHSQWLTADVELNTTGFTSDTGLPDPGYSYQFFTSDLFAPDTSCLTPHPAAEEQAQNQVNVLTKECTANNGAQSCFPIPD